jgi:rhodanese-related sulfurtransferase
MNAKSLEISVTDLLKLRDTQEPYILLDVREPSELLISTLPDSLHMPMQTIPTHWQTLPQDQRMIVFCHYGIRSRMVVEFLQAQGFNNVFNLDGGIDAWAQEIEPEMRRY